VLLSAVMVRLIVTHSSSLQMVVVVEVPGST
jgi:hypothetical protein